MRIAIIGTGGIGGYVGAKLWKAGNEVTFVARGRHLDALRLNGLTLRSPDGDITVHSTFTDMLTDAKPFDLFIVAVKSFDTQSAAQVIRPAADESSIVLSFQNGVENETILAESMAREQILAGVAYVFSTIASPGVVEHSGGAGKFKFGEIDGSISERCLSLEKIFRQAGIVGEATKNIEKALYEKWIFICGLGGMTAYARKSIGEILSDVKLSRLARRVVEEATAIARVKGIGEFAGFEEKAFAHFRRLPPTSTSSMYYDLIHGKRIELDALNGAVVRFGKEPKIPAPANEIICNNLMRFA